MTDAGLMVTAGESAEPVAVLVVAGEIDRDSVAVLAVAGREALGPRHDRLVLDLTGVTFCDSAGLSALLDLRKRAVARGGSVHLAGTRTEVLTVLQVTNLERLFPRHATVADAVTAALSGA